MISNKSNANLSFIDTLRKKITDIFLLSSWDDHIISHERETISDIEELEIDWFIEDEIKPRSKTNDRQKESEVFRTIMNIDLIQVPLCK